MGLVTFGTNVMVHELGFAECPKSFVFRGSKEYAAVKVSCAPPASRLVASCTPLPFLSGEKGLGADGA